MLSQKQLSSTPPIKKTPGDNLSQRENWQQDLKPPPTRPDGWRDPMGTQIPVGQPAVTPRSSTAPDAPGSAIVTSSSPRGPQPSGPTPLKTIPSRATAQTALPPPRVSKPRGA
jgi:hypothetical protein